MKVAIEITGSELEHLLHEHIKNKLAGAGFYHHDFVFEAKMTYGEKENWRVPKYIRVRAERSSPL